MGAESVRLGRYFDAATTADTLYLCNVGPDPLQVEAIYVVPDAAVAAAADVVLTVKDASAVTVATAAAAVTAGLTAGTAVSIPVLQVGSSLVLDAGASYTITKSGAIAFSGGIEIQFKTLRG